MNAGGDSVEELLTKRTNAALCWRGPDRAGDMLPELLHSEERKVWGDGGYQGQTEVIQEAAPKAQNMTCKRTRFKNYVDELQRKKSRSKSSVRAKVEHVFRILKRAFVFDKVRYRGIATNYNRLCANFALVNLYLHRKRLAVQRAWGVRGRDAGLGRPQTNSSTTQNSQNRSSYIATLPLEKIKDLRRASLDSVRDNR